MTSIDVLVFVSDNDVLSIFTLLACIHDIYARLQSIPLGAKLDDGSVAIGAALLAADSIAAKVAAVIAAATPVPVSEGTIGEGESIQTELNPLPPDVVPGAY